MIPGISKEFPEDPRLRFFLHRANPKSGFRNPEITGAFGRGLFTEHDRKSRLSQTIASQTGP